LFADPKIGKMAGRQCRPPERRAAAPDAQGEGVCREGIVALEAARLEPLAEQQRADREGFSHFHRQPQFSAFDPALRNKVPAKRAKGTPLDNLLPALFVAAQ
jgi:hypothetical protein